jgi:hypothetical protein
MPYTISIYLINLQRAILKLFLLLSQLVGYTFSLINKYYNNTQPNYINNISASLFTIYITTTLIIVLINIASFNHNVTTAYSYIISL